ncbi:Maf family protein [Pontibaca salina]|uniref:Nucleoside triphosphate pyrophosphatase n=1 Tax=Pontibaca salina TaxID=2795731 RepID=A0A934HM83_9RHOB|nr:Maf family nucleotide pyrophosphatase [Pontibaca salina]MBI6629491.1 septum formation protein Maf [Pontibaca salina]
MVIPLILASGSSIRAQLLANAAVPFQVQIARIDEQTMKAAMLAEHVPPRDIADALAEAKARRVSNKHPESLVLGCDQLLDFKGKLLSKPETPKQAVTQLRNLRGHDHKLLSAAVICQNGQPIWRHIGQVRLRMRAASDDYIDDYVARNWDSIRSSVGAYKLEEEGVRLFSRIEGDYFHVLGMPLLEILNFLATKGVIEQ